MDDLNGIEKTIEGIEYWADHDDNLYDQSIIFTDVELRMLKDDIDKF